MSYHSCPRSKVGCFTTTSLKVTWRTAFFVTLPDPCSRFRGLPYTQNLLRSHGDRSEAERYRTALCGASIRPHDVTTRDQPLVELYSTLFVLNRHRHSIDIRSQLRYLGGPHWDQTAGSIDRTVGVGAFMVTAECPAVPSVSSMTADHGHNVGACVIEFPKACILVPSIWTCFSLRSLLLNHRWDLGAWSYARITLGSWATSSSIHGAVPY
ncbi:hypothetical protein J3A83DRAFT_3470158 [Scleroderma citrinum]